jgi:hypothetical protein
MRTVSTFGISGNAIQSIKGFKVLCAAAKLGKRTDWRKYEDEWENKKTNIWEIEEKRKQILKGKVRQL